MSAKTIPARVLPVCSAALLALLLSARVAPAQSLDLNGNGLSDIWELNYNAQGIDPDLDSDGDGVPNRLEAIAGTDPFNARSVPRISTIKVTANGAEVTMAGALGKQYQLQSSEVLCGSAGSNWVNECTLVARSNPVVTLTAPTNLAAKFFRVVVADVDSDGDGLNDWEEYQLGLDPFSATSNGKLAANGKAMNDYDYAVNWLKLPRVAAPQIASTVQSSLIIYPTATTDGTGLTGEYFYGSSTTYTNGANFDPVGLFLVTNVPAIDFRFGPATVPNLSNVMASVRWTGQVQPQYSEVYTFETRTDDGVKLWVNDQLLINRWQSQGTTSWTNALTLQAGVRYNLRMEYFNLAGSARAQLYWYSPSQVRQIIPTARLYPASDGLAPGGVSSPLTAIAFVGQPFSYTIAGANSPFSYGASNLPPGLAVDSVTGVISGTPALGGSFDILLSVTNAIGAATADLDLEVIDTGSSVSREVWTNVIGNTIATIPLNIPAPITNVLGALEGITNFGDNYAERIRGYITAPVSGNYYFWIAANNTAELWIANDDEPVNKVRRAYVADAKVPMTPRQWNAQPGQRSAWLELEAGRRYYIEVLHKAGRGAGDHWSVGWLLDPLGTNTVPGGLVPGYLLSPYSNTPPATIPGTLFSANMVAQSGALSSGVGSATLRLSPDETQAILKYTYSGLSTPVTAQHIHADAYQGKNDQGQIVFDIDAATPQPDGSYVWTIVPVGTLTSADLVEIIKEGKSYINIHTVDYPSGEINGHFTLAAGTSVFSPPPAPPAWVDDHANSNAAARFLLQATFGPSPADLKTVKSQGYSKWIDSQFKLPVSGHLANVLATASLDPEALFSGSVTFNTWWQRSITAPDQLRQRVAFALSEIMVVSESGVLNGNPRALSSYYDLLLKNSFGNFRDMLKAVTLSPAMGLYLDMRGNDKGNPQLGTHPNENYAREILQLFSVGLNRTWPDGTLVLNSKGDIVPTYDQDVIIGYARVFTGWNYWQTNLANRRLPNNWYPNANYTNAMVQVPTHHELGTKRLLDNVILPGAQGTQLAQTNVAFDAYCTNDLNKALDVIFNNQNVGPFICRELIQRLVTSHPSREYIYRVTQKFNDNGLGVRGDMKAVIKAILLDYEARSAAVLDLPSYGKQREPVLRATAIARAFPPPAPMKASFKQFGSQAVTISTAKPHRLSSGDDVFITFSGKVTPMSQIYNNVTVLDPKTFTVNSQGISAGGYSQSGTTITVTNSGHGLSVGYQIDLTFTSGGAPSGIYTVTGVPSSSLFTVASATSATRSGTCVFPKWNSGQVDQTGTNATITVSGQHGLRAGNNVYIVFPGGNPSSNGVYRVIKVLSSTRFTIFATVSATTSDSDPLVLPLAPAPATRSGSATIRYSTWAMNYTDSGFSATLSQTPLNSPTVFNFFFPDYRFPGVLSSAGLTTPEFQLTSDTSIVMQMNFISGGVFSSSGNTNGLASFASGNGAVMFDVGSWMTPALTADAGIPNLVDALSSLLCAGQLAPAARAVIINYVANPRFAYNLPTPTFTQMRDRVRAVVHLIVTSPDFAIQR